jgi:hypothetical protein
VTARSVSREWTPTTPPVPNLGILACRKCSAVRSDDAEKLASLEVGVLVPRVLPQGPRQTHLFAVVAGEDGIPVEQVTAKFAFLGVGEVEAGEHRIPRVEMRGGKLGGWRWGRQSVIVRYRRLGGGVLHLCGKL